jgi:hypothetical protein
MKNVRQRGVVLVLALALVGVVVLLAGTRQAVLGGGEGGAKAAGGPRYSVVLTEGHNLLVTDNGTNKLYFYTVDKDRPIGSPLKLRASLDLTNVGRPEIRITEHNVQRIEQKDEKKEEK